jgi:hypothetical protein
LFVSYTGQWMNEIYWIFKATRWKWDENKWIVQFGTKLIGSLPMTGQILVVISLIWVSLSTTLLFELFLMDIPMEGIVVLEFILRLLVLGQFSLDLLDWLTTDAEEASTRTGQETTTTTTMCKHWCDF